MKKDKFGLTKVDYYDEHGNMTNHALEVLIAAAKKQVASGKTPMQALNSLPKDIAGYEDLILNAIKGG